jgi:hypothetical protein
MSFLRAEWRKLAIANFDIEANVLDKYVPFGTELDFRQGKCYVSLVGFMFVNTKILGIKIPYHTNFEEVNLRFYVKRFENGKWKRAVVFIKEIVPRRAITCIANCVYNENYQTLKMKHCWEEYETNRLTEYQWNKKGKWQTFRVISSVNTSEIKPDSETEFITEHYWGYSKRKDGSSNEYEVTHPRWKHYEVLDYELDVDFELSYGSYFGFLNSKNPCSVMLAEGSEITVEGKKKIEYVQ